MRRNPIHLVLVLGVVLLTAAAACGGDPNVEGAKLDLANKDYDRALENVNTALENNPNNAEAHYLKGQILQDQATAMTDVAARTEAITAMMEAYNRAVELDPGLQNDVTQRLRLAYYNEFQEGGQAFNRARQNDEGYDEAIAYFENAALIQPDSAGAYINMGYSMLNAGRAADAIEPFEAAIATGAPVDADVYIFLGDLYATNDRAEDAVTLLQQAREIYPEDPDIQAQLMNAYVRTGQEGEALSQYQAAVEREPDNKVFRYNYGSLLLNSERYDEAIEQLEAAVAIDPNYASAQYNLGAAYVNKAVDVNEQISELDDKLRAERANLSEAEVQQREAELEQLAEQRTEFFDTAIPPLEKAREMMETAGDDVLPVCQALFQSYVQTGQTEEAEATAECAGYEDMN